jgi:RNA polymerase sigma-70 factor (ECF subfamily)
MVHTVSGRIMRNTMDAEEVTQDVFVKAFQRLAEFEGTGKFSTWLYSIAYRTAISAIRNRKERGESLEELKEMGVEPSVEPSESMADRKRVLEFALATLAPEDAAILTMFHLEEMSVEEIVTVTELGASNVKVKLHRGRKKLHEILRHHLKDELWTLSAKA